MDKHQIYEKLLQDAQSDPNIIGFILGGGRGKSFSTERSDYDVSMIVPDGREKEYQEKYKDYDSVEKVELGVQSLSEFRQYALWGSESAPHAYNFTHLKAQVDKTGEIQKCIDEKGKIPAGEVSKLVSGELDKFLNYYYRALKNSRDDNITAAWLDAVESIPPLIAIFFGLEGRLRPYNKYLEWELETHPLHYLPWKGKEFLAMIKKILATGDIDALKEIYKKVREMFGSQGYSEVIGGWDGYDLD